MTLSQWNKGDRLQGNRATSFTGRDIEYYFLYVQSVIISYYPISLKYRRKDQADLASVGFQIREIRNCTFNFH